MPLVPMVVEQSPRGERSFDVYSPGGDAYAAMAIYDAMQFVSCEVATICCGIAMSGGSLVLAGGAAGKRMARSRFTSEEAVAYGLCDRVIASRAEAREAAVTRRAPAGIA